MANPLPDKVLGNDLGNSEANSSWATFSNTVTKTSEIAEWEKSRWCVSKEYDWLIREAVDKGYEYYEDLPEDMQFALVMEIIKVEKGSIFSDFDNDSVLADCIIQIMLKKGNSESFTELYDYLKAHFIQGLGNKPACFANIINVSLEAQQRTKVSEDEEIHLYGDPDNVDKDYYQFLRR